VIFPIFGSTQLEVLSVFSACLLLFTHAIMAWCAKEQPLVSIDSTSGEDKRSFRSELSNIWRSALSLPRTIRTICIIQFLQVLILFNTPPSNSPNSVHGLAGSRSFSTQRYILETCTNPPSYLLWKTQIWTQKQRAWDLGPFFIAHV